jgi:hypothetical protein
MGTVRNLALGDVIPQMGFSPSRDKTGGWLATRSYSMLQETWESASVQLRFAQGSPISTADPSVRSFYNFFAVDTLSFVSEDSGTGLLTVNYTGSGNAQYGGENGDQLDFAAQPVYRLDGRLSELPLSEHEKWLALTDEEKFALGGCLTGRYQVSITAIKAQYLLGDEERDVKNSSGDVIEFTGDALEFAKRIRDGRLTFKAPTAVYTETTQGNTPLTNDQLNKLGKISNPRGNPPEAGGTRNWRLEEASQTQRGLLYNTSLVWEMSPREGHDDFLYG